MEWEEWEETGGGARWQRERCGWAVEGGEGVGREGMEKLSFVTQD